MKADADSCLYSGLASVAWEKAFGEPGALKTADYLLMAGPIGKYIISGSLHAEQQQVVFRYPDLLGSLWEKSITPEQLDHIEAAFPEGLTEMECVLPAWELNINRHMVLHLVEAVRQNDPCWTWSMFGFEQLWNRLLQWMSQGSHPEATMLNAFTAFNTATAAAPEFMSDSLSDVADEAHGGSATSPFQPIARFDRATYELILPSLLHVSTPIELADGKELTLELANTLITTTGGRSCTSSTCRTLSFALPSRTTSPTRA